MTKIDEWQHEIALLKEKRQSLKYENKSIANRLKVLRSYILTYKKRWTK